MIRWQSNKSEYSYKAAQSHTKEVTQTDYMFCIPVSGVRYAQTLESNTSKGKTTATLTIKKTAEAFEKKFSNDSDEVHRSFSLNQHSSEIPHLMINLTNAGQMHTGALTQAAKTGGTNATTGGLIGAAASLLLGGPGTFLLWTLCGAGAVGVVSGAAQGVCSYQADSTRDFARRCNEFLGNLQEDDLFAYCLARFKELCADATSYERQQLLRDIVKSSRRFLRQSAADQIFQALLTMPSLGSTQALNHLNHPTFGTAAAVFAGSR